MVNQVNCVNIGNVVWASLYRIGRDIEAPHFSDGETHGRPMAYVTEEGINALLKAMLSHNYADDFLETAFSDLSSEEAQLLVRKINKMYGWLA